MITKDKKIYVNIASYRDPMLPNTIDDVLSKAKYPERVVVGVAWQRGPEELDELPFDKDQVKVLKIKYDHSRGCCWARSLCFLQADADTDFFWMLDSHMRVAQDWDEELLRMYYNTGNEKSLMSCAVPMYQPPGNTGTHWENNKNIVANTKANSFIEGGILMQVWHCKPVTAKPELNSFLTACNLFGPYNFVKEVPYDPNLFFYGEEITLCVRAFTHGWNHYTCEYSTAFHKHDRDYRIQYWDDHTKFNHEMTQMNVNRCLEVLLDRKEVNLGIYGRGNVRTLDQYQKYSGVNFKDQSIDDNARTGKPNIEFI